MPYLRYNTTHYNTNTPIFSTSEEIAQKLKVSEYTVRRWVSEGKLNGIKIGKAYRFSQEDIDNFINKFKTK